MEFRSLISAGRENVIQTYLGLASVVDGSRLLRSAHFSGVVSIRPYSFCNFMIGLEGDLNGAMTEVVRWSRSQPALRVFTMTGDTDQDWRGELSRAGFTPLHRLVQMGWEPDGTAVGDGWRVCSDDKSRDQVAEFMVQQFFAMNEIGFRRAVIQATARGNHDLCRIELDGEIVAAAMVVQSPNALGLYNVCVSPMYRQRGYGESIVRSAQSLAKSSELPLILQCEENLVRWYCRFGFQVFGEMQSFQCRFR